MSEKQVKAIAYHDKGYNCAQAVACVFAEDLGWDVKEVFHLMEAFGFGMGSMGTCGAVSAMAAVIGMKNSDGDLETPRSKKSSYGQIKALRQQFIEKNGSDVCSVIKGVGTGNVLRSCPGCIEDAVAFLESHLAE